MKKSFRYSRLSFAIPHKFFKLTVVERTTATQLHKRICDQPELSVALIRGHEIHKRSLVEHNRSEAFHSRFARTRQHRLAATEKHRHAQTAAIVKREPVSIRASHGK
jgi:hypothetical protein